MNDAKEKIIYIVEDDDGVRDSTRVLLEVLGFAVKDFADAESFLQATEGRDADCLIVDLNLPGISGLDLLELLRTRGVRTPAIMMTANGRKLAARSARAGVVAVLRKPAAPEALSLWLEEVFSRTR